MGATANVGGAGDTRRLLIMSTIVIVFSLLFLIFFFRSCIKAPDPNAGYTVIYSNLELKDAANVVTQLKALKIPYQVRDEGKTVAVPKEKADDARLGLAVKSLPAGGSVGWEIFDTSKLGTTDFDRRIQFIRAISGELSRTIMRIEAVQDARVQIVIPQTSLFQVTEVPVTASVLLQLKTGRQISKEQVNGIVRLVASSVENLRPENVTIIDVFGNVLSGPLFASGEVQTVPSPVYAPQALPLPETAPVQMTNAQVITKEAVLRIAPAQVSAEAAATKEVKIVQVKEEAPQTPEEKTLSRLKTKEELENRLSSTAQKVINSFYPPNSILVKISVDLAEYKSEASKKPAKIMKKKAAISSAKICMKKACLPAGRAKAQQGKKHKQAIQKKKFQYEGIKKMTVIVLIDNRFNLTPALKKTTAETIMHTLFFNPKRGDKLVIRQVPFHYAVSFNGGAPVSRAGFLRPASFAGLLKGGTAKAAAVAIGLIILLAILNRLFRRKPKENTSRSAAYNPVGGQQKGTSIDRIKEAVSRSPERVAELLQNWMSEEERKG